MKVHSVFCSGTSSSGRVTTAGGIPAWGRRTQSTSATPSCWASGTSFRPRWENTANWNNFSQFSCAAGFSIHSFEASFDVYFVMILDIFHCSDFPHNFPCARWTASTRSWTASEPRSSTLGRGAGPGGQGARGGWWPVSRAGWSPSTSRGTS